jgi:hypothetical protein
MRAAVDLLIDYDRRRRTALLDTLERYLSSAAAIESARALYIHPNTLRQRAGASRSSAGWTSTRTICSPLSWPSSWPGCTAAPTLGPERGFQSSKTR